MDFTQTRIDELKKQHPGVNLVMVTVDAYSCILKPPTRKALGYAMAAIKTNPMKYNELLLDSAWVDGDEIIKTDNGLFLSVSAKLGDLVNVQEAELVKL